MRVTIRLFGLAAARFGRKALALELPPQSAVSHLLLVLQKENADVDQSFYAIMNFLVNGARADQQTLLNDGDEIMIMSSVGGG